MLAGCLCILPAGAAHAQADRICSEHDRLLQLELRPHELDPQARELACTTSYACDFDGHLYIWADPDVGLQVLDAEGLELGAHPAGKAARPVVRIPVLAGQSFAIRVVAQDPRRPREVELHFRAGPETDETLEARETAEALFSELRDAKASGDVEAVRALLTEMLTVLGEADGSRCSPMVEGALRNVFSESYELGEFDTAVLAGRRICSYLEEVLPPDHPDVLVMYANLANVLQQRGEDLQARAVYERVLREGPRVLGEDDLRLQHARWGFSVVLTHLGDLAGARCMEEQVLRSYERILPEKHPELSAIRVNVALSMLAIGDEIGAQGLLERVVEDYESTVPDDHLDLNIARHSLALALRQTGEGERALELLEHVVSIFGAQPRARIDLLWVARSNLATLLADTGDWEGAVAIERHNLEALEGILPPGHPTVLQVRGNLAMGLRKLGLIAEARDMEEEVLSASERLFSEGHPDVLKARRNLLFTVIEQGDEDSGSRLASELIAPMRRSVLDSILLSPREAMEAIRSEADRLALVAFALGPAPSIPLFELIETMRMASSEALRASRLAGSDAALDEALHEVVRTRVALSDLASTADGDESDFSDRFMRLATERDRWEREARRLLQASGASVEAVEASAFAPRLDGSTVAVGYRRLPSYRRDESTGRLLEDEDRLLAHVLREDGSLARLDLGAASRIEVLVEAWRAELGRPLHGRGFGVAVGGSPGGELESGTALREAVLDPVLAVAAPSVSAARVCLDDILCLVPLDALPLGQGRVGDRIRIVNELSFGGSAPGESGEESPASLLVLGGVDYSAEAGDLGAPARFPSAPVDTTTRALGDSFEELPGSLREAESIAQIFSQRFKEHPGLWTGRDASKERLHAHAPGKRYLHLATHGWFAPSGVPSTLDAGPRGLHADRTVRGFGPMTLCGIALAGANRGRDELGRVPGILTAEELASFDLRSCELAVLSACETNVGIRRSGQGVLSLQTALHAAGARSSITSLWRVDDVATQRLFELFYIKLWKEGLGKHEALWQAKTSLRAEGHPPRDWAAWVLNGDPD